MQEKSKNTNKPIVEDLNNEGKENNGNVRIRRQNAQRFFWKTKLTNRFRATLTESKCNVRFATGHQVTIKKKDSAYFEFLEHWDKRDLYFDKSYKILVISRDNKLRFELSLEPKNAKIIREELTKTLQIITGIEPCLKVYLGQNNPHKPIYPTTKETQLARFIKRKAAEVNVEMVDQIIMSNTEYFSFVDNKYLEPLSKQDI